MTKEEALKLAFEELEDIQFIDNTCHEASVSKVEVKEILSKLADRLTFMDFSTYWTCPNCHNQVISDRRVCSFCDSPKKLFVKVNWKEIP